MAKKVKCPQCGAKNAADARRCRVCTAIINAEVPEQRRGFALGKDELGREGPPPVAPSPAPQAPAALGSEPAAPIGGGGVPAPGDGIVIDAPRRNPAATAPPPGAAEGAFGSDADEPGDDLFGGDGIVIETAPRNPAVAPPPLEVDDEPFDPNGLIIDPPR